MASMRNVCCRGVPTNVAGGCELSLGRAGAAPACQFVGGVVRVLRERCEGSGDALSVLRGRSVINDVMGSFP